MKRNKINFEKYISLIDSEISKRRNRWTLHALSWLDFDDVSQIVRIHAYNKLHLYDESKPILPWINRLISNQIKNIIRNNYGNYTRPCLKCAASLGEHGCRIYNEQCEKCPLFKNWAKNKKAAYDLKVTVSMEEHSNEINNHQFQSLDMAFATENLNKRLEQILKPIEWQVYKLLYIENKSEKFICRILKLKYDEKSETAYNKQLRNIQKIIIRKARQCLLNGEVDV
jgi:hypothetical protein